MPVSLTPGNTAVFTVAPTFSGSTFTTVQANAFVQSSSLFNFPVKLVTSDATGLTFQGTAGRGREASRVRDHRVGLPQHGRHHGHGDRHHGHGDRRPPTT